MHAVKRHRSLEEEHSWPCSRLHFPEQFDQDIRITPTEAVKLGFKFLEDHDDLRDEDFLKEYGGLEDIVKNDWSSYTCQSCVNEAKYMCKDRMKTGHGDLCRRNGTWKRGVDLDNYSLSKESVVARCKGCKRRRHVDPKGRKTKNIINRAHEFGCPNFTKKANTQTPELFWENGVCVGCIRQLDFMLKGVEGTTETLHHPECEFYHQLPRSEEYETKMIKMDHTKKNPYTEKLDKAFYRCLEIP